MLRWGRQVQRLLSLRDFRLPSGEAISWPSAAFTKADSRAFCAANSAAPREYLALNNLSDNPGASKIGKRLGRGIGSGKGKTSGRGHKGQKARTGRQVKIGFEGGQTPIKRYAPKRGFININQKEYTPLNLHRLKERIDQGRLSADGLITMRELRASGTVQRRLRDGVKLLGGGASNFDKVVHLQVSQASAAARQAVEQLGGSVTTVYYNELGLRALVSPEWFEKKGRRLPRPARPPPKKRDRYDAIGALPPVADPPRLQAAAAQ